MTWPTPLQKYETMYFGDDIPESDRLSYRNPAYGTQFDEFKNLVLPVEYNGGWEQLLRYVGKGSKAGDWKLNPTTEECWLAQEDLWVQRELLAIIKTTLETLGDVPFSTQQDVPKHESPSRKDFQHVMEARGRGQHRLQSAPFLPPQIASALFDERLSERSSSAQQQPQPKGEHQLDRARS